MKNEFFTKADLLIKKTQKLSSENKYFLEKLNELKSDIQNKNDLSQIIDNFEILENLSNRINFELNNQKSFFQKTIDVMSKMTKALSDGIFSIPKGLIEIDPNIKTYFAFALSVLNIGATSARAIEDNKNHLATLSEITMFIKTKTVSGRLQFSMKALDNNDLNIEIIPGLTLKKIFESFGNSDYLTDDQDFSSNKYKVKIDYSIHENIVSTTLVFPEKIEYKKSEFTQTFQFIGQINNIRQYNPIKYTLNNKFICDLNNNDYCLVDKLNGLDSSLIKDYKHQVVSDGKNISTIHSYENERKITYVNGHSRETNIDIYGNVGIDRFSINSISYASNSTNTLPTTYVDEQNKQVIINGFGNNRCFDFSLNAQTCLDVLTTTSKETTTNEITTTSSPYTPDSTTSRATTTHKSTSSTTTLPITSHTSKPTTHTTTVHPTTISMHATTKTLITSVHPNTQTNTTAQQQISDSTSSNSITFFTTKQPINTATTPYPYTTQQTKTQSNNSTESTIFTKLQNLTTTDTTNSSPTNSPEENKNNESINPLLWIAPTALLGLVSLGIISYFSIQAIRRKNYRAVGSRENGSVSRTKFHGSDTQSDDSITVLNMQNYYGTTSTPVFAFDQQRRKNEENKDKNAKNNSFWSLFSRKKNVDEIQMDQITAVTTISESVSANPNNSNQNEYSNLDSPTTSRQANQEMKLNEAAQTRKKLFENTLSTTIEVKSATLSKKEIDRLKKENKEYQNFVQLFIEALQARINLKNRNLNELKLPDCSQIMSSKNSNLSKQYYVENAFKYDSMYKLFPGGDLNCKNKHDIEKLFNELYKSKTNNEQEILNGKMKSEILDDLYILLFDQGNKWYETEIFKNNQEDKLMEALNTMQKRLKRKERDLNQQSSVSTSIV
jgi:hypothetical protein